MEEFELPQKQEKVYMEYKKKWKKIDCRKDTSPGTSGAVF